MPRISVIVPVYRAENSLCGCAASILRDAPADLELILVEDGSPDGSGVLCNQLAEQDLRVRAIHQPNGGASAARNTGIAAATGDYLLFVDADDQLLPGLWAAALPQLEEQRPDLYVFGVTFTAGGQELPRPAGVWASPRHLPDPAKTLRDHLIGGCTLAGPVAKLYRRQALGTLRFDPTLRINEDILLNTLFLAHCGKLIFDDTAYYRCDNQGQSLSRQLRSDLLEAEAYTRPALAALLQTLELSPGQQNALLAQRQLHCALAQFGLLAGRKGRLPLGRRRALTRQILAVPGARQALAQQYRADPNRLLALPYRLCLDLHADGLLAVYCAVKNRFV